MSDPDPVVIPADPAQVTADVVRAVWDMEGAEGVADWIRELAVARRASEQPGLHDRIVREARQRWPEQVRLHGWDPFDVAAAIDLAVHIALSMVQQAADRAE